MTYICLVDKCPLRINRLFTHQTYAVTGRHNITQVPPPRLYIIYWHSMIISPDIARVISLGIAQVNSPYQTITRLPVSN